MAYQSEGDELADRGLRPMNLDGGFTPGNADALLKINKNADDILNKSHISNEELVNLLDMEQDQLALDDLINNYKFLSIYLIKYSVLDGYIILFSNYNDI